VLDFQVDLIEAEVLCREEAFALPLAARLRQVPLRLPEGLPAPALTFSGGVGELIYLARSGAPLPGTTAYGDLGVDLARRILASPVLCGEILTPASTGRATSFGLLRHSTQLSGATLFLPHPEVVPHADVPILRTLPASASAAEIALAVALARRSARGGCLALTGETGGVTGLRQLGARLADALAQGGFAADRPLVILTSENIGKALGGYVTAFGKRPASIVVIDEIAPPDAQFIQIGRPAGAVVPVSFHGMNRT
jgi:ethanolamine utilization protein EutA